MKRLTALLMSICIVLCLAACGRQKVQWTSPDKVQTNSTGNSSDHQIITEKPLICVSVPVETESFLADDGTEIFRHVYQHMSLIVTDPEVADKVTLDFLNRSDGAGAAEAILESAKKNYRPGINWTPYLCQISYDPMRIDAGVLSLFGSYATYSGTPHPESSYLAVSYDLLTGDTLTLDSILADGATTKSLSQLVIDALNTRTKELSLFDGFEETIEERFSMDLSADHDWYFSDTGLCFFFSPYEIAPYASGVIVSEISYDKLAGLVDDTYMPAEQDSVSGSITAKPFTDDDIAGLSQFAEIRLADNGSKLLLTTSTAVQALRIETGVLSRDGKDFTPDRTVFATSDLTVGNAVVLDAARGQVVRLTYRTGEKTVHQVITVS